MRNIVFIIVMCFALVGCKSNSKEKSIVTATDTFIEVVEVDLGTTPEVGRVIFSIQDVVRVHVIEYDHGERFLKLGFTYSGYKDKAPVSIEKEIFSSAPFSWRSEKSEEQSYSSVNIFANWNLEERNGRPHVVVQVDYRKFNSSTYHF